VTRRPQPSLEEKEAKIGRKKNKKTLGKTAAAHVARCFFLRSSLRNAWFREINAAAPCGGGAEPCGGDDERGSLYRLSRPFVQCPRLSFILFY